jgi:hypothetical protein
MIWIAVNNVRRKHNVRRVVAFWHDERSKAAGAKTEAEFPQSVEPFSRAWIRPETPCPGLVLSKLAVAQFRDADFIGSVVAGGFVPPGPLP